VGHEGGNPRGEFCFTLTETDIATGWTKNQSVRNKAQVHVFAAIRTMVENLPFPIRGIDSDNGSEFINAQLFRYGQDSAVKISIGWPNDGPALSLERAPLENDRHCRRPIAKVAASTAITYPHPQRPRRSSLKERGRVKALVTSDLGCLRPRRTRRSKASGSRLGRSPTA
jgi:hypothetical protein